MRELLGERDLSHAQAAAILGQRLGLSDLEYRQLEPGEAVDGLIGAGFAPDLAAAYVELARSINAELIRSLQGRNATNTPPTRFEDFAEALAQAYRAM